MGDTERCLPGNHNLGAPIHFRDADWQTVPNAPGVYVIYAGDEVLYVGMAGRNGRGSLRNRLKDHASGQIVNMFAQYLFLARVQHEYEPRIIHPREAKTACRAWIAERCTFRFAPTATSGEARALEAELKRALRPALNP